MKWWQAECKFGDLIRVRCGVIYHFGIFVSEDEVIQFGLPPDQNILSRNNDEIEVCVSDIDTFCGAKAIEVATLEKSDKVRRFSPKKTVRLARSRIGEKGYHIIHNNCEHFARECYCGERRCETTEKILSAWNNRSVCDIYITEGLSALSYDKLYPRQRQRELRSVKSEELRAQKYLAWKTLEYALMRTFGCKMSELKFKKSKYGKWSCDRCFFSISHSGDAVAVAVSDSEVGIDIEDKDGFSKRFSDRKVLTSAIDKLIAADDDVPSSCDELLTLWTKKESAYKFDSDGVFAPSEISLAGRDFADISVKLSDKDYLLSVCGHKKKDISIYFFDGKSAVKSRDAI